MKKITLIATCKYGLEKMVKHELMALDFDHIKVSPGRLEFEATPSEIPKANLWLRCADRVRVKVGEFKALTFDELFEQTKALPWEEWITEDGEFTVTGRSVKSTLFSVRSCQAIVKKAVVQRLGECYNVVWFDETGPQFTIEISMLKDMALLTIDTSGVGLHKRGYREQGGEAPLKETLAAALVQLSFWNKDRHLIDPMCGSGTILIEAAMMARNIAPGLSRGFASEEWPAIPPDAWREAREAACAAMRPYENPQLFGYDIDPVSIETAQENARQAGVSDDIVFAQKDIKELWIDKQYGIVITNPPYGMRMAEFRELNQIYISLHKTFKKKRGWSLYVFTADEKFPFYFKRARPDRVRKLYNGRIKAYYYQYYGEKPPDN
ncbi:MAG: THUMP domain-containing class I SAM-dependent RNA methyltransferase [Ardenticatenaceae bacterium]